MPNSHLILLCLKSSQQPCLIIWIVYWALRQLIFTNYWERRSMSCFVLIFFFSLFCWLIVERLNWIKPLIVVIINFGGWFTGERDVLGHKRGPLRLLSSQSTFRHVLAQSKGGAKARKPGEAGIALNCETKRQARGCPTQLQTTSYLLPLHDEWTKASSALARHPSILAPFLHYYCFHFAFLIIIAIHAII